MSRRSIIDRFKNGSRSITMSIGKPTTSPMNNWWRGSPISQSQHSRIASRLYRGCSEQVNSWAKPTKARKPRKKRVQSADRQVKALTYASGGYEDFKLSSINPVTIPGSQHLYVFNARYKALSVYHSASPEGFAIKGSSMKNYDEASSYTITLRKPEEILTAVNTKTPKQIEKIIEKLTTKKKKANGRINGHCILHRVVATRKL
jgi:hypothetical protein